MTRSFKYALAAVLTIGAAQTAFAGDGLPNTNYPPAYPSSGYTVPAPRVAAPAARLRTIDAFALDRRAGFRSEQYQQDRMTDNVNNN